MEPGPCGQECVVARMQGSQLLRDRVRILARHQTE